ncbi:UbiD family decarboxylase [Stappia sp. 28M-7]|uniref:UbiD family decarboxylase n=1 Tax=Stappia sp. 28M-7 TaxID=2762596 RepID=UPI00163C9816|nr:UbiD family decarboxylase [Stappia sp. 28M-7]MBC2859095.1 UbiD family decarboxylase [Stappia sp. 28M-7]
MRRLPAFPDLRSFLRWCDAAGEMCSIAQPVRLREEVTAVHRKVLLAGGPVLRFERPLAEDGSVSSIPLIANLFGTRRRVAAGLGIEPADIAQLGEFLAALRSPVPPQGVGDALSRWPQMAAALRARVKVLGRGVSQEERMGEPDLSRLPVQTCWPGDAGPLMTWPVVLTRDPGSQASDSGRYNAGIYRAQVLGPDRLILRWLPHRGAAAHHRGWVRKGEPMPVAIALGADPALLLAAALPLPETVSELAFSGVLRGARTSLAPAVTVPMLVPSSAEIVVEGWVHPQETAPEGPFGDHTGYYNSVEPFPVMRVSAITHRRDPLYLSTWTGRPPDEPSIIGEVFNELALPVIRQQIPEVVDLWLPPAACSYRIAVIAIEKRYPGQARRVMLALWGLLAQFSYTKMIVVVDADIDPRNWDDIAWALATRYDPARDTMLLDRTPMDYLDFASPLEGLAGKIGLDATVKLGSETDRAFGEVMRLSPEAEGAAERILKAEGLA